MGIIVVISRNYNFLKKINYYNLYIILYTLLYNCVSHITIHTCTTLHIIIHACSVHTTCSTRKSDTYTCAVTGVHTHVKTLLHVHFKTTKFLGH